MKGKNNLKIAIVGAGAAGLACAHECERLGVIPDLFERDFEVGWIWPSVIVQLNVFQRKKTDILKELRKEYHINIKPWLRLQSFTMKSPIKLRK